MKLGNRPRVTHKPVYRGSNCLWHKSLLHRSRSKPKEQKLPFCSSESGFIEHIDTYNYLLQPKYQLIYHSMGIQEEHSSMKNIDFPGSSVVKNPLSMQETRAQWPGVKGNPLDKDMVIHSSILAWEIPRKRNLVGYSPWGRKRTGHDLVTKPQQMKNMKKSI